MRLDRFLRQSYPSLANSLINRMLRKKQIFISTNSSNDSSSNNNTETSRRKGYEAGYRVAAGELIYLPRWLAEQLSQTSASVEDERGQAKQVNDTVAVNQQYLIALREQWHN